MVRIRHKRHSSPVLTSTWSLWRKQTCAFLSLAEGALRLFPPSPQHHLLRRLVGLSNITRCQQRFNRKVCILASWCVSNADLCLKARHTPSVESPKHTPNWNASQQWPSSPPAQAINPRRPVPFHGSLLFERPRCSSITQIPRRDTPGTSVVQHASRTKKKTDKRLRRSNKRISDRGPSSGSEERPSDQKPVGTEQR